MDGKAENVIFATASYDFDIKLWQPFSGVCLRTLSHPDHVSFIGLEMFIINVCR